MGHLCSSSRGAWCGTGQVTSRDGSPTTASTPVRQRMGVVMRIRRANNRASRTFFQSRPAIDAKTIALGLGGHRVGSAWMARCPAHEDSTPSLSITESRTGKLLVFCHAGCSQVSVIARLRERGLWHSVLEESMSGELGAHARRNAVYELRSGIIPDWTTDRARCGQRCSALSQQACTTSQSAFIERGCRGTVVPRLRSRRTR